MVDSNLRRHQLVRQGAEEIGEDSVFAAMHFVLALNGLNRRCDLLGIVVTFPRPK